MLTTRCASVLFTIIVLLLGGACTGGDDAVGAKLSTDASALQTASAAAMGEVTGARFSLVRSGAPVFIDPAGAVALDGLDGVFAAPSSAQAELEVTVGGALRTRIGAVAIGDEIWLSNPLSGEFETLPSGYDIDPSGLFDPKGAWQPLLENLRDIAFVAEEQRNGVPAYHLTGVAPEADISGVTAGIVRGSDVDVDVWLDPITAHVLALEFDSMIGGVDNSWVLELGDYGESFSIVEPTIGG